MKPIYRDREHGGRELANRLRSYAGRPNVIILGLPRGGVPVGFEVAESLGAELDVYLVRKLGVPGHEELAMGAVAAGGVRYLNQQLIRQLSISERAIESTVTREEAELQRQSRLFRGDRPPPAISGKIAILVDDGLATGATMAAAVTAVRQQQPARVIVAVPVAPPDTCEDMARLADEVVCCSMPTLFGAVGLWYSDFSPVDDEAVRDLLNRAREHVESAEVGKN